MASMDLAGNTVPLEAALMPRDEAFKAPSVPLPRLLRRNYRTSSLNRWSKKKVYYMSWSSDRPRITSSHSAQVPDTEPEQIEELWTFVRNDLNMTSGKSSIPLRKSGGQSSGKGIEGQMKAKGATPSGIVSSSDVIDDASTVPTTAASARIRRASPYDKDFREQVLTPRGIFIVEDRYQLSGSVWEHFQTEELEPHTDRQEFYRQAGSKHSAVWLSSNDEAHVQEVVEEYKSMVAAGMCEAEFATYAKQYFFLNDRRKSVQEHSNLRVWKTDRMIELVAKAGVRGWEAPPILRNGQEDLKVYEFDIRPDCGYWLSMQAFNNAYVTKASIWAFVLQERITCPYLFVEFKKDGNDTETAENQVAAAASVALYNRYWLRIRRLQSLKEKPKDLDLTNIKSYAITFRGASYTVWCIRPNVHVASGRWKGCTMTSVHEGKCIYAYDVQDLSDWLNEIHRWGLSIHGPNCENDITICITKRTGGSRVSDTNEQML